jgi:hypothetical protein
MKFELDAKLKQMIEREAEQLQEKLLATNSFIKTAQYYAEHYYTDAPEILARIWLVADNFNEDINTILQIKTSALMTLKIFMELNYKYELWIKDICELVSSHHQITTN